MTTNVIPSVEQQKTFIIDNSKILNLYNKKSILSIVMISIGKEVLLEGINGDLSLNLDIIGNINKEILYHIYNIVNSRLIELNQPIR